MSAFAPELDGGEAAGKGAKKDATAVDAEAEAAPDVRATLARLWPLAAEQGRVYACATLALALAAVAELAVPHFASATIFGAASGDQSAFRSAVGALSACAAAHAVFSGMRGWLFSVLNYRMVRSLRRKLFGTLVRQEVEYYDEKDVGELTSRLGSDVQAVARCLGLNLNVLLRNAIKGVFGSIYLFTLSPALFFTTAGIGLLHWFFTQRYGELSRRLARAQQDAAADAGRIAEETLSLAKLVRQLGGEARETARYGRAAGTIAHVNARQAVAYGFYCVVGGGLYYATKVGALLVGGGMALAGAITAQELTAFMLYVQMVIESALACGEQYAAIMEGLGSCEKVLAMASRPVAAQLRPNARLQRLPQLRGDICLQDVCFAYAGRPDAHVLCGTTLRMTAGETTALVGRSGSGKSTVAQLIQGLYAPTAAATTQNAVELPAGEVSVDGVDLRQLDAVWLRAQMGVVGQEPRLFRASVLDNILYSGAAEAATQGGGELEFEEGDAARRARAERAAVAANAHEFIMQLPQGYNTTVGSSTLSGGQKQRLAIARALARDPTILILDEATSALDAESQQLVSEALQNAISLPGANGRRRTTLIVAHRLSTVRTADSIVVMDRGEAVEQGTHEELLALEGAYYDLCRRSQDSGLIDEGTAGSDGEVGGDGALAVCEGEDDAEVCETADGEPTAVVAPKPRV